MRRCKSLDVQAVVELCRSVFVPSRGKEDILERVMADTCQEKDGGKRRKRRGEKAEEVDVDPRSPTVDVDVSTSMPERRFFSDCEPAEEALSFAEQMERKRQRVCMELEEALFQDKNQM